jgi:WD40 repeat protein
MALPLPHWAHSVAFAPSGKEVAVCGNMGMCQIVALDTGASRSLNTAGDQSTLSWSPDGTTIVVVNHEERPAFWDVQTTRPLEAPDGMKGSRVVFSPDGKWIAAGGRDKLAIWDAKTRAHVRTIDCPALLFFAWHKDSRLVAVAQAGRAAQVIDTHDGKKIVTLELENNLVAWSPDGTEVLGMHGFYATFCDAVTGKVKRQGTERGYIHRRPASLSPDGKQIVSNRLWDAETGELFRDLNGIPFSRRAAWSPRQNVVAFNSPDKILLYSPATGALLAELKAEGAGLSRLAWSPDGSRLATGGEADGIVRIWDAAGQKMLHSWPAHEKSVIGLAWSPDGEKLATGGPDKSVRLWAPATGEALAEFKRFPAEFAPHQYSECLVWGLDSRTLWLTLGRQARRLDTQTGEVSPLEQFADRNAFAVNWLALARDGDSLLMRVDYGWIFLQPAGRLVGQHLAHDPQWHPDARRFVGTWSESHMRIRGYDTRRERRLGTLIPDMTGNHWLVVGPDGHWRGSAGVESQIVYVAMLEDGSQQTFTPAEFEKRFGWKNDPGKARLLKLDPNP